MLSKCDITMMPNEYEERSGSPTTPPKDLHEGDVRPGAGRLSAIDGGQEWSRQITPRHVSTAPTNVGTQGASASTADTSGSDRKIRTLQDMIDTLEPPETAEQRKKRERKEKSAKIISAVSDGLRAMSNLFFTSQYAPNMYNHEKGSQLNAQNAAIEKARKDREANADKYLRFALALGDAENERAKTAREVEAEKERRQLAREKAEREQKAAEAERALDPFRQGKAQAEQSYWEHKATVEGENARVAPELADEKVESQRAQTRQRDAAAGASRASAAKSYAAARAHDRSNRQVVHHFNGKTYPKGSNDYEKDVREAARQYNQRHGEWVEGTDANGKKTRKWVYNDGFQPIVTDRKEYTAHGEKIVPRKAEEYAGEVESAIAKEREDNTPPGRRKNNKNNKDNTPPSRQ